MIILNTIREGSLTCLAAVAARCGHPLGIKQV
jgi:hypothetical protein